MRPSPRALLALLAPLAAGVALAACASGPAGLLDRLNAPENTRWVFVIGNSHSYDVPWLLEALNKQRGGAPIRVFGVTEANYALEDHWTIGTARPELRSGHWDYVILQQGPSAQAESQLHLRYWTQQWAPLVRAQGAEPVLYQVWPESWRREVAADVLFSYSDAAAAVDGILAPAGDAFTAALESDPGMMLYAADGFHASMRGLYLAAVTILARIDAFDPRVLPDALPGTNLDAATIQALQEAAAVALARNPARP